MVLLRNFKNPMDSTPEGRIMVPVSMNRIVPRSAVELQARFSAGLSLYARPDAFLLPEHAALIPILWTDAALAAATPVRASDLAA